MSGWTEHYSERRTDNRKHGTEKHKMSQMYCESFMWKLEL